MTRYQFAKTFLSLGLVSFFAAFTLETIAQPGYSPYAESSVPRQVFWGDTHLHSDLSMDAMGFGLTLGPDAAYRFAAGEEVISSGGEPVRLGRALDFVLLADHAEALGMMALVKHGDQRVLGNETTRQWHQALTGTAEQSGKLRRSFLVTKERKAAAKLLSEISTEQLQLDIWQSTLDIAQRHYRPGKFTTLLGYEWTSVPGGSNLHRVVMFRDDAETVGKTRPFSSWDSDDPVDLWRAMAAYENNTQGQVLAIPHNGNLSNGLMFPLHQRLRGEQVDKAYASARARWEPVIEVTQIKGDGETHPLLSPDDEFADYETWDDGSMGGVLKTEDMLPQEYARSALRSGLQLQQSLGVNPYQFGMIGSTDSHTALAAVEENNFFGKHSGVEPNPKRWNHVVGKAGDTVVKGAKQASSGYAAVWALDNTRESLFDAIARREVYATTGPRISVRLFGGWDFKATDALLPDIAAIGYAQGVPMGGELPQVNGADAPGFLVSASKDSLGANLDRIQIVKGWLDSAGESHEKVYNVAWSGDRQADAQGQLADVGNTVDIAQASWSNSIGAPQLASVWTDPDFDPRKNAFYYARVIEIPTPRWTAYDARRFRVSMDDDTPMITRERAYTSPIWYRPKP